MQASRVGVSDVFNPEQLRLFQTRADKKQKEVQVKEGEEEESVKKEEDKENKEDEASERLTERKEEKQGRR